MVSSVTCATLAAAFAFALLSAADPKAAVSGLLALDTTHSERIIERIQRH